MGMPNLARYAVAASAVAGVSPSSMAGRVVAAAGLAVKVSGLTAHVAIGDRINICPPGREPALGEIVAFGNGVAHAMAFQATDGVGHGAMVRARTDERSADLRVSDAWIGRIIDPLANPLDGRGRLEFGTLGRSVRTSPPEPVKRARLGQRIDLGICVLNAFATCRTGQRLGLFAGSGVGKSTLLSMLARYTECDVAVLALVGERGREVREFIEDDLGEAGLKRAVVVVATSDAQPLMRREAAYTAMTVAEHFRDDGKSVLLLMDSVTRFCLALREIGFAAGEPPATRGYPSSVFAELPRLLERAGPGHEHTGRAGQITAFFTVLVEGDDQNEPVADAVRGILDGHIVLDRILGERGRFPAVDVLRSVSRAVPGCNSDQENDISRRARNILAVHSDIEDLIRLGAYRQGVDPKADEAVSVAPRIEAAIRQRKDERYSIDESFERLHLAMATR